VTEPMPDFAMPSEAEVARERAHAGDEAREAAARARMVEEPARRGASEAAGPSVAAVVDGRRGRLRALARNPVATFVAGAALVAAAFAIVPAIERQVEAGSVAELDRVVAEYVEAVAVGDFAAATRMAPVDDAYADAILLDEATPSSVAGIACDEPDVGDARATVSCAIEVPGIGGGSSPIRMQLVRDGSWRIETGLAVASPLFVQLARVDAIGGVEVPSDVDAADDPLWLYPGSYDLALTTAVRLESTGSELGVIGEGFLWLGGLQPSADLRGELTAAAVDYVATCAETAAAGCPEVAPPAADELFEVVESSATTYQMGLELVLAVTVRRVGGAPDRWPIDVVAAFEEDLQSFEVLPRLAGS
jgi:hypothetical protein